MIYFFVSIMYFLATDSGLEKTGFCLFKIIKNSFNIVDFGLIKTEKKLSIEKRLIKIYQELEKLINVYKPKILILEQLFFNSNKKTLISIAQAQGVLITLAGQKNLKVKFLTPLEIKQTVTGYGRADKEQVRKMVKLILPTIKLPKSDDIIDAVACGLSFFYLKNDRKN